MTPEIFMSYSATSPQKSSADWIVITTDGSCYPNDGSGAGGWAYVIRGVDCVRGESRNWGRIAAPCTNNRAEFTAILKALASVIEPSKVRIRTDSQYALNSLTRWAHGWKRNGWKTASGQPVKNRELIEEVLVEMKRHLEVDIVWVEGHAGDGDNELCDKLAAAARRNPN